MWVCPKLTRNNIRISVAVDVRTRHVDTAVELFGIREKAHQFAAVAAIPNAYMRAATRPGCGDDVERAIAIDIG